MSLSHRPEVRVLALERIQRGEMLEAIHRDTGIAASTLRRWRKESGRGKPSSAIAVEETVDPARLTGSPHEREDKAERGRKSIVLAVPDLHTPAVHPDAIDFLKAVKQRFRPNVFIQLGDELDFHALSRWPKNPDLPSAGNELSAAIEKLIPFYLEFPEMKVCVSNHTTRGHRLAFNAGLPQAFLNHIATILNAPDGWVWADEWIIDNTLYFHGDRGKHGQYSHVNYLRAYKMNCVHGHVHAFGGVNWEGQNFAVNSGCLIDTNHPAFDYARGRAPGVSLGCTLVIGGMAAYFIPLLVDRHGRWIGRF